MPTQTYSRASPHHMLTRVIIHVFKFSVIAHLFSFLESFKCMDSQLVVESMYTITHTDALTHTHTCTTLTHTLTHTQHYVRPSLPPVSPPSVQGYRVPSNPRTSHTGVLQLHSHLTKDDTKYMCTAPGIGQPFYSQHLTLEGAHLEDSIRFVAEGRPM